MLHFTLNLGVNAISVWMIYFVSKPIRKFTFNETKYVYRNWDLPYVYGYFYLLSLNRTYFCKYAYNNLMHTTTSTDNKHNILEACKFQF